MANNLFSENNGNTVEERMIFEDDPIDHDDTDGQLCSSIRPSVEINRSKFSNANQTKPENNCAGHTVTGWKLRQAHSLENIKEMLGLSASTDGLGENIGREASCSDISEEDSAGLDRVIENVDVTNSAEFLFKDTYFEDMENLEFVYDPILCLSSENLAPEVLATVQNVSHCPGCNCSQLLEAEPFDQDPGKGTHQSQTKIKFFLVPLKNVF